MRGCTANRAGAFQPHSIGTKASEAVGRAAQRIWRSAAVCHRATHHHQQHLSASTIDDTRSGSRATHALALSSLGGETRAIVGPRLNHAPALFIPTLTSRATALGGAISRRVRTYPTPLPLALTRTHRVANGSHRQSCTNCFGFRCLPAWQMPTGLTLQPCAGLTPHLRLWPVVQRRACYISPNIGAGQDTL